MTDMQQARPSTPEEDIKTLYGRTAKLSDYVAALLDPAWGSKTGIIPSDHPLHMGEQPDTPEATQATDPTACDAYQPPTTAEMTGLCARCGMYDYRHQPTRCCVCGGNDVTYENFRGQQFCTPCSNCPCGQTVCVRTGINDPAVSPAAAERGRIASVLAEVLAAFTTTVRDEPGGRVVAYLAQAPIHPDDMQRWRSALSKEQTR